MKRNITQLACRWKSGTRRDGEICIARATPPGANPVAGEARWPYSGAMSPETPAPSSSTESATRLQELLSQWFAPWVQELGLQVQSCGDGEATLRLPFSEHLARRGGMVCGQALMSAADTAMVLAIVSRLGEHRPMTTVQLNTSFLKPLAGQDALVTARIVRAGKSLVFGEIDIVAASDGKSVCRASTTYALL